LLLRVESADLSSGQMAEELTGRLGKPMSAVSVRKTLERAKDKFADLLLDEVTASLEVPSAEELHRELQELDLLRYCESALQRRH